MLQSILAKFNTKVFLMDVIYLCVVLERELEFYES